MTVTHWDERFLEMAQLVAGWSRDPSTQTGAVIVRPDHRVVSLGFNGFPRGMPDESEYYENREEKYSRIIHCEMNALLFATQPTVGCTLYTWPFLSCDRCFVHMIQAGIVRAVAPRIPQYLEERWGAIIERTKQYATEAQIEIVEVGW